MGESSPIVLTIHENQDKFYNEENEEELSVTVIPKVAFTTTGASSNQEVEISNNEEPENKTTLS